MKHLLFLVHRIPYPPNKGDKIRSYHFLKGLAEKYQVHLATFIDDPEDWKYVDKVKSLTTDAFFVNLNPSLAKIKSLVGLINNKALTLPYYQNNSLQTWVDNTIKKQGIEKIVVFSSSMAQFVEKYTDLDIIIDFVDVDSDKWLQYSKKATWPMNWVYRREADYLLNFDKRVATTAKMNFFVSEDESLLFRRLTDLPLEKIGFVNNGVDTDYFNVADPYQNPYNLNERVVVFTGAMDYWANVDAVTWFVNEVMPLIRQQYNQFRFYIVGSKPTKEVLALANKEDVIVTGRVEDIRPYLAYADVVVAPLLIARGIQNKVLEAMAMGKRVVATPQAIEGIKITDQAVFVEQEADAFAHQVVNALMDKQNECVLKNRQFVENNFSWDASFKQLQQKLGICPC